MRQENFECFVLAEKTGQLASPESCAYTEIAASSQRNFRVMKFEQAGTARRRGHVRKDNPV